MIAERYAQVLERIRRAEQSTGRTPGSVRLVVVTKGHPNERVREVVQAGARVLGENYVDEALEKIAALGDTPGIAWHMIGHIQSRKARAVAEQFDFAHSVDSLKLAERLARHSVEAGRVLPVLLELNVSGEETKFGYPAWEDRQLPALEQELLSMQALAGIQVRGLMSMAPYGSQPEAARPYFCRLRQLGERLEARLPGVHLAELSMGMSGDFEAAIQEGATLVRVGEAILGPRPAR